LPTGRRQPPRLQTHKKTNTAYRPLLLYPNEHNIRIPAFHQHGQHAGDHFLYPTLELPAGTPAGDYHILFVADFNQAEAETNETDNIQSVATKVISPFQVDLTFQSTAIGAGTASPGQNLVVQALMANYGNTAVLPHRGTIGFYLSANNILGAGDVLLATDTVATTFAAGSTEAHNR
jgi:hypothetical protein